eukprot:1140887-Pelagomonas_calceolata.AAC.2
MDVCEDADPGRQGLQPCFPLFAFPYYFYFTCLHRYVIYGSVQGRTPSQAWIAALLCALFKFEQQHLIELTCLSVDALVCLLVIAMHVSNHAQLDTLFYSGRIISVRNGVLLLQQNVHDLHAHLQSSPIGHAVLAPAAAALVMAALHI